MDGEALNVGNNRAARGNTFHFKNPNSKAKNYLSFIIENNCFIYETIIKHSYGHKKVICLIYMLPPRVTELRASTLVFAVQRFK
jgi:hypothetical protein